MRPIVECGANDERANATRAQPHAATRRLARHERPLPQSEQSPLRHPRRRGIGVDPLWQRSFTIFHVWALVSGYQPGLALVRVDKSKGFTPGNCRWSHTWIRCHDARPVVRSDGHRFESLSEAVRQTPRAHAYGIHRVSKGLQKTCGGFGWKFDQPEGGAS